jgi:hypothetical protein
MLGGAPPPGASPARRGVFFAAGVALGASGVIFSGLTAPLQPAAAARAPAAACVTAPPSPPPPPASSARAAWDAASFLAQAALPAGYAAAPAYAPWPGASRARGWAGVSAAREDALACVARAGGLAFIGDSTSREAANVLLEALGGARVDTGVPHARHAADAVFGANASGGGGARVAFRFSKHFAAREGEPGESLAERIAELGGGANGVRAFVVNVGLWELNPSQGGAGFENLLQHFARAVAAFLREMRERALPALAAAAPRGAAPVTLIWRAINPTLTSRVLADRAALLAPGRAAAANALVARALGAWNAREGAAGLPRWRIIDTFELMPQHALEDEGVLAGDGYHPCCAALRSIVDAALSEACGRDFTSETLDELAA